MLLILTDKANHMFHKAVLCTTSIGIPIRIMIKGYLLRLDHIFVRQNGHVWGIKAHFWGEIITSW